MYGEPDDDLDAFIAAIDAALTEQLGPNHQEILGEGGATVAMFDWRLYPDSGTRP